MERSPAQLTSLAKYENTSQTTIAPISAPMSGRASSFESGLTRVSRSSPRAGSAVGAAVSVMVLAADAGRAAATPAPDRRVLARALRGELRDLGRVRLVDDPGAGQHRLAVADRVQVRDVEHREDHGQ